MGDLVSLDDVSPLPGAVEADDSARDEYLDLERAKQAAQVEELQAQIEYRKRYAGRIFIFVSLWILAIFAVMLADGWGLWGLEIADPVMVTLVGGTTASVLGIFAIVANYFFPKGKD